MTIERLEPGKRYSHMVVHELHNVKVSCAEVLETFARNQKNLR